MLTEFASALLKLYYKGKSNKKDSKPNEQAAEQPQAEKSKKAEPKPEEKIKSVAINNVDNKTNNTVDNILNKKFNDSTVSGSDKGGEIVNIIKDYPIFADGCKTVCGENRSTILYNC